MSNKEVPLIWTTKGNVPVDSLEYWAGWEVTENFVKFREQYRLEGEIVRENAHVMMLKSPEIESITQPIE
ncbi:MAG TPA: hypothetical protein PKZ07_18925 [Sedimentisphaerales bacterium]|jgi:hypothetical protein|nr:hypothetical protein [Sedimentisphaerales bacterium]